MGMSEFRSVLLKFSTSDWNCRSLCVCLSGWIVGCTTIRNLVCRPPTFTKLQPNGTPRTSCFRPDCSSGSPGSSAMPCSRSWRRGDPPEHHLSSHGAWPRRCCQATQAPEYHFKLLPWHISPNGPISFIGVSLISPVRKGDHFNFHVQTTRQPFVTKTSRTSYEK